MTDFKVTRGHLKCAVDQENWDLLDKLLEIDNSLINDNSLFTDTWGDWWGMLLEAVYKRSADGVRVLLKHGAQRDLARWGDGMSMTAMEAAEDNPEILALLQNPAPPNFVRKTEPELPSADLSKATSVNRQGEIRDATGLVFQIGESEDAS
jgi:hypothetical protein